jgi:lipopolysaccharide transport system permease protein
LTEDPAHCSGCVRVDLRVDVRSFSLSPRRFAVDLWDNRSLLRALVVREILGRYQGSVFGVLWSLFNPVLMLTVYTFVFSVVFKARWTPTSDSRSEFALALFVGLIAFNLFAECVNRAPNLILSNANYVKKVVFPLEILPIVSLGAALFHAIVSVCVWLLFYVIAAGVPHWTVVWTPILFVPLVLLVCGLSWALAALGVYLRDVGQITALVTTVLMFLSPVFYPVSALPASLQVVFELNPLTPVVEMLRDVLMWGRMPRAGQFGTSLLVGSVIAWLGFILFQKTRKGFADVL